MDTRRLADLATLHRLDTERDRRLAKPVANALAAGGFCRVALPEEDGGRALEPEGCLAVFETLARAEAAVSWIAWNNSLVCLFSRFLAPPVRSALFRDPGTLFAQSTRPTGTARPTEGGYRVNGRWALVSGCELADWMMLLCAVDVDGSGAAPGAEMRFVFLPRRAVEILDTWDAGGLRGSGSHDVVVTDEIVAAEATLVPTATSTLAGLWGSLPIIPTLSAGFAAQTIGLAAAALDTLRETARSALSSESELRAEVLRALSVHRAAIDAARGLVREEVRHLAREAVAGGATPESMGAVYAATAHSVQVARAAVDAAYDLSGTSAVYTASPLERIHRDLRTMLQHVVAQPLWVEDAGRVSLGLEPQNPLFAV